MRAAIYLRTSTKEQQPENQRAEIEAYCKQHGYDITGEYIEQESAWIQGHQAELARLLRELRSGQRSYDVLCVLAMDRLTRGGGYILMQWVYTFAKLGVKVVSVQESGITDLPKEMQEIVLPVLAFYANYDSTRKSKNIRAGQAYAKIHGTKSGKAIGSRGKDKTPRHKAGYLQRWAGKQTPDKKVPLSTSNAIKVLEI